MPDRTITTLVGGLNLFLHPTKIADNECQVLENMEVRPTNVGDNKSFLALTARFSYKRLNSSDLGLTPKSLVEFVQANTGVGTTAFTGAGLNDATFGGTYAGTTVLSTYEVEIDSSAASPDTFKWRKDAGGYTTGVSITAGVAQTLAEGVTITFVAGDGHTLGDKWIVNVSPSGTKWLVTGGWDGSANFVVKALRDGQTSPITIKSQASSDTGICSFLLFGQYLYFTNGALAWRRWNGLDEVVSGFTTITKYAVQHKNKAIYLNDVTNKAPNQIWVSSTGNAETVPAVNNFLCGDHGDAISSAVDQLERLVVIKEKSIWGFYLAPALADSSMLRGDQYKGSISPLGHIWGSFGTYLYSTSAGIQAISGLYVTPTVFQIMNQLRGFQNTGAVLAFKEDQVLISTFSDSTQVRNNRVYSVDVATEEANVVFQANLSIGCFCLNQGTLTFAKKIKAMEDDGTNRYFIELDQVSGAAETNIACVAQTKDFMDIENKVARIQNVNFITVEFLAPNTTNALTLKIFGDGMLVETLTFTPTATGFNRKKFLALRHLSRGLTISYRLEYTQPSSNATRFAILNISDNYNIQPRVD